MMEQGRHRAAARTGYWMLCAAPFVAGGLAAARPLRIPGVHQMVGVILFALFVIGLWVLARRVASAAAPADRLGGVAGGLMLVPFTLIGLLWVGLGTPWEATPAENLMRYAVLLIGSLAVTAGFIALRDALRSSGVLISATLGFSAAILAGAAYLVWVTAEIEVWSARARRSATPGAATDTLLFAAGSLTYLAAGAFALSCGRAGWIGRRAAQVFAVLNLVALALLVMRGFSFPYPTAGTAPWFTRPGFIVGIPAIPWIMPHLLGVTLLRRAGTETL